MTALPQTAPEKPRRPLRPLHGIPDRDKRGPTGLLLSTLIHGIIVLFLFLPPFIASQLDQPLTEGGGGPGAAGGGGGGTGGSGGSTIKPERVRYLQVAPIPQVKPAPTVTPPVIPPPTPPKEQPKPEPKAEVPPPTPTPAETKEAATTGPTVPTAGTGGGSGHDGSGGNGPGSGGGVGSGVGTGRGSGNGPGTGGGDGEVSPPYATHIALLPMPVPNKVKPYEMVAWFDVDEKGNTKLIAFNPSKDSGYNKKIREMLAEVRFRPATRRDGTAVRDTVSITVVAR